MDLKGKNILITGGARVGQAVAKELVAAGANLAMTYLADKKEVYLPRRQAGRKARGYQANLTEEGAAERLVTDVLADFKKIDGLVNMVSVFMPDGKKMKLADLEANFKVNAFGNMLVSRLVAETAKKQKAKNVPIISFIDWAVDHPYPKYDSYIAAKAALRHYLMALQTSFAGIVRVVNIHPGMILEPPKFPVKERREIINNTPTGTIGDASQAAKLVKAALELDYLSDNINLAGGQQWRHRL